MAASQFIRPKVRLGLTIGVVVAVAVAARGWVWLQADTAMKKAEEFRVAEISSALKGHAQFARPSMDYERVWANVVKEEARIEQESQQLTSAVSQAAPTMQK